MSWVTAGIENGVSLQYKITDCCIEKRFIDDNGVVIRHSSDRIQSPRHRDQLRSFVDNIPRMYSKRSSRHNSMRGGRKKRAKRTRRSKF